MMKPHYYLMKNKKILRLEESEKFSDLSWLIKAQLFDGETTKMNQDEANWRVAIFRDEIMEISEFVDYLHSPESVQEYLEA